MINTNRSFVAVVSVSLALIILASGFLLRGVSGANSNDQTTRTTPAARNLLGAKLEQTYALDDFNGDGSIDVAVTDFVHDTVSVMVGDRAGHFHSVARLSSGGGPRAMVAADFNRDGAVDLAVANFFSGDVAVFAGRGDGDFEQRRLVKLGEGLASLVGEDFDSDGSPDLAVANFLSGQVMILKGAADGSFAAPALIGQAPGVTLILTGDSNKDGVKDLIAFDVSGGEARLFAGDGSGSFLEAGNVDPMMAISLADAEESRAIRKLSGDGQSAPAGSALPQPLVAEVSKQDELRKDGKPVVFSRLYGDAKLDAGAGQVTDEQGQASLALSFGESPGNNLVAASAEGRATIFGEFAASSYESFFKRIRDSLDPSQLLRRDLHFQHSILDQAERRLSEEDLPGAVNQLRSYITLLTEAFSRQAAGSGDNSVVEKLIRRLINQILLLSPNSPASPAAAISCGETICASITSSGQQDAYIFNGNANEIVNISAVGASGALCPAIKLISPSGGTIYDTFPFCNTRTGNVSLPVNGTYTIIVYARDIGQTGTYCVNLQFPSGRCAAGISCGQTVSSNIGPAPEMEVYAFSASAGEIVNVSAFGTSGNLCPAIELLSPSGTSLTNTFPFCNTRTGNINLPTSGTYKINVYARDIGQAGNYNVNLQFTSGRCGAPIACGQTVSSNISPAPEMEVYTFSGDAGEIVRISAVSTSGNLCPAIELLGPSGSSLTNTFPFCNTRTGNISLPTSGAYKIVIYARDIGQTGAYNVNLQFTSGRCGTAIAYGQTLPGSISPAPEMDVYTFCGRAGATVDISAVGTSGNLCPAIQLLGPSGSSLTDTFPFCNTRTGNVSLTSDGTYKIIVYARDIGQTGAYNVNLTYIGNPCTSPPFSASGRVTTVSGAGISGVTMNFTRISGTGALPASVVTDASGNWNQTGFQSGTTYRVTPVKTDCTFNPASRDFSSASTELNFTGTCAEPQCVAVSISNTLSGPPQSSLTVPIMVSNLTGRGVVSYDFTLTFDPNVLRLQNPPVMVPGTISSAMNITPNATSGSLSSPKIPALFRHNSGTAGALILLTVP